MPETPQPGPAPSGDAHAIPIHLATRESWPALLNTLEPAARLYATSTGFKAEPGKTLLLPGPDGALASVLFGIDGSSQADPFAPGRLATALPAGTYRFSEPPADGAGAMLGWLLAGYRFDRYRERQAAGAVLLPPPGVDSAEIAQIAAAVATGRDLINTPANDLGPDDLEEAARRIAERHDATVEVTLGDDLLDANLPLIHAVGRASPRAPRLIDLTWGDPAAPAVTLVGKGVCFDTGGLDIKPSAGMLLMKKDMGGAAVALALGEMVMSGKLPVRLRVLVPAVENAISGSSFRPGDVLRSRKGLTVEIGNTDAEGRLILADALALGDEDGPELMVDFATLTGAARVALGPDLPAAFTDDEALAADLARLGPALHDPVWRLPLWPGYRRLLDSKIADLNNAPAGGMAGAVTAALFLQRYVSNARAWLHLDVYAWNPVAKPGRPEGGEVQTARLLYGLLKERYPAAR